MRTAVDRVVAAQEILRTQFRSPSDSQPPLQVVSERAVWRIHEIDFAGLESAEAEIESVLTRISGISCSGQGGAVLDLWLVRRTEVRHLLILAVHPLCGDLRSLENLAWAILTAYAECHEGRLPQDEPIQYIDVAGIFLQLLELEDAAAGRAYWHRSPPEAAHPPALSLASGDGGRPGRPVPVLTTGPRYLPEAAARLSALAASHGGSLEDLLVALWLVLLARLGSGPRLTAGVACDGRGEQELVEALGLFARYLPLRLEVVETSELGALVLRVREALGEMRQWQDFFDGEGLDAAGLGFCPFCFDFVRQEELSRGGLKLAPLGDRVFLERFHLFLSCRQHGEALSFTVSLDSRVYATRQAEDLAQRFQALIDSCLAEPAARVGELEVLTSAERQLFLVEVNATDVAGSAGQCAHHLFEEQAARTPAAVALRAGDLVLTYGELEAQANRFAHHLQRLGVGPETCMGIRLERSPELVVALLGILKAGGTYVPVDPAYPEERQAFLLEDAGVSILLVRRDDGGPGPRRLSLEQAGAAISQESADRPSSPVAPGHLAYVLYTSGSTGRPKGVMVSHAGLVNYLRWCARSYTAGPGSAVPVHSPLGFDLTVTSLLAPLTVGWSVVLIPEEAGVEALADAVASGGPWGLLKITPSHLEVLAHLLAERRAEIRVGTLVVGGEALRGESLSFWARQSPETGIVNEYGPTEAVVGCCTYRFRAGLPIAGPVPIGRPIENGRIYLLTSGLRPVPVGVPGQLFLGGLGLARGYRGRPDLTAERFLPDPFAAEPGGRLYRSGDLARWLPGGNLEFLGRVDHQVKIRGFRIELGEIEVALGQHPAVREVVAAVREDLPGELRLVAYLVPAPGAALVAGDLRRFARQKLPEPMVPSHYVELAAVPLTANGKVDRAALPPPGPWEPEAGDAAPQTALEDEIAAIWKEVLGLERVGRRANFFDLGGHSLLVARVRRQLERRIGRNLSMVDMFRYPTIASLAAFLDPEASAAYPAAREVPRPAHEGGPEIAVVGLSGRFPGAADLAEFWRNLRDGVEGITFFSTEELRAAGADPKLLENPNYVRANGILRDVEWFDAAFFGFNPREAAMTDPQQRIFLECAWETLESAGYDPERYPGRIGVFAGVSANTYWHHLAANPDLVEEVGGFQLVLANDKDFLPTRVSYKLNLTGPSINVQTACSTSLVAVHLACRSLRNRESDMVLAGGISVRIPQQAGYLYQEGGISSPDGHCRAFDARAQGTLRGSGVGIVVLKRLSDALDDGDTIHAVIRGSAINNDGARKIGFTAPSVEGQVTVLREAFADAGIEPDTISYVETHGTGTALGDPIEVAALSEALGAPGRRGDLCALGSVKTNVGHLDAAAGVAGLIKTVLALKHQAIPPSLHFQEANPDIDFASTPCFVNASLADWPAGETPRRAGVSAFGIGGTNAHVVLEEAPAPPRPDPSRPWQLVVLSARTATALEAATRNLTHLLASPDGASLADVAYTLQVGRRAFDHRRFLVANSLDGALEALRTPDSGQVSTQALRSRSASVVFLFPGQGSQSVGMGRELYETERAFREPIDHCAERLMDQLGFDFRDKVFREPGGGEPELDQTALTQPVLFSFEYALARLWIEWGVRPQAMVGHSLGEYVAACLAGVFRLEDALTLVAVRGRMMQQLAAGSMLAVRLSEGELRPLLLPGLSLAAVNGPSDYVVSGPAEILGALRRALAEKGHDSRAVATSHAFHSEMMDPILEAFAARVRQVALRPPAIPFLSNLTGTWITEEEATDPEYWARHLRRTVQFSRNLETLFAEPDRIFLEVGPGRTLSSLLLRHPGRPSGQPVIVSLPPRRDNRGDLASMLEARGRLWLAGVEFAEPGLWAHERRRRLPLPTYPWERQRFWIEARQETRKETVDTGSPPSALLRKAEIADWFHVPAWRRTGLPVLERGPSRAEQVWLVFADGHGFAPRMVQELQARGQEVLSVEVGDGFTRLDDATYLIDPQRPGDYERLVEELRGAGKMPRKVVHLWNLGPGPSGPPTPEGADEALYLGFYSLIFLIQALGGQSFREPLQILVVATGLHEVTGEEALRPERATLLGPCRVLPQEYRNVSCRSVDLELPASNSRHETEMVRWLLAELDAGPSPQVVAYRGKHRWVQTFDTVRLEEPGDGAPRLREQGVYLLTGGLGGLGLTVARHLAQQVKARLVLVGRTPLAPREQWNALLAAPGSSERLRRRIEAIRSLEELGAEVLVVGADVSDRDAMRAAIAQALGRFGRLDGVLHAAGVAGSGLIDLKVPPEAARVLDPKVRGALVLRELLEDVPLDFFVLFSSLNSVLGGFGQVDYCAANTFLDAFAHWFRAERGASCTAINWVAWQEVGIAAEARPPGESPGQRRERLGHGIRPAEGIEVFRRALQADLPQVLVSPRSLEALIERVNRRVEAEGVLLEPVPLRPRHARPEIATSYVAPRNETERILADLYTHLLGLERVGVHDNFFELGGDSLLSIQIVARAGEAGLAVTTQQVFEHPTIADLGTVIAAEGEAGPEPAAGERKDRPDFPLARLDSATLARLCEEQGEVEDIYPLSPTQSGMLFFHLYAPASEAYFQLMVWSLRGTLDIPAFKGVWTRLVERHSALRTCFVWQGLDEPHQVVHRRVELSWIEEDLRGLSENDRPKRLQELLQEDREQRLDLSRAPILRLAILRLGEDDYQFVWSWHHILFDGWSMTLLTRQAVGLYQEILRGETSDREPAPQYHDYIAWLQNQQAQDQTTAESFWRRALEGFSSPTPLPFDRSPGRLVNQQQRVRGQQSLLSVQETAELRAFARRHQLTLGTLVQGAWALLLAASSGEQDVVFGITSSGRPASLPGVESIVGLLITTLPLRALVRPQGGLIPWLRSVQQSQTEVRRFEHSSLAQIQAWSRVPEDRALFDSLLVFQGTPADVSVGRWEQTGLSVRNQGGLDSTSYPLVVYVVPGRELKLRFAYDSDRFDVAMIHRLRQRLEALLRNMVAAPEVQVSALFELGETERQQILVEWNDTRPGPRPDRCVHELFEAQVERTPQATALTSGWEALTYQELNRRANRLACLLRGVGVGPEVRVGVLVDRSPEAVIALLGTLKAGGVYVPLDLQYPRERLAFMLEDAEVRILLAGQRTPVPPTDGIPVLRLGADVTWEKGREGNPAPWAGLGNLAYVIYTSGSTGAPKGVTVTHANAAPLLAWSLEHFGLGPHTRVLQTLSPAFDFGLWEVLTTLLAGGVLHTDREAAADPERWAVYAREHGIGTVHATPSFFREVVATGVPLPAVEILHLGGEALTRSDVERMREAVGEDCALYNGYGPTEATVNCLIYRLNGGGASDASGGGVPIGRPSAENAVYVLERGGLPAPAGVPGELCVGGPGVARGYLGRAALTAERFVPDPYSGERGGRLYRTGDLARWRADGNLEYLGRLDHQVKVRGFRIELGEVEAALLAVPGVREAVVVARGEGAERSLVSYVVPVEGRALGAGEVREHLRGRLPEYMVPSGVVILERLPLTPNGKIDRKALPAPAALEPAATVLPRTPLEEVMAVVWGEVLGVERVGTLDNFFALGGHSLLAMRVVSRLRQAFGVELGVRELFEHPTLASLSSRVESALRQGVSLSLPPLVRVERRGAGLPLSYAQQRLWFLDRLEPQGTAYNVPLRTRLSGPVDVAALARALREVVRRHEVLRTRYEESGGEPVQVLEPVESWPGLAVLDLSALPEEARRWEGARLARQESAAPFDLRRGPVFRVRLLRLEPEDHHLVATVHHIASDEWSGRILLRELTALYEAFGSGRPSPLAELPVQYGDYAAWQRSWMEGEALEGQLAYWRQRLAGAPALLELPTDRPRPAAQTFRGSRHPVALERQAAEGLRSLARREEATPFMAGLALLQLLLCRLSGSPDVSVGTPISGRSLVEVEDLIGFFLNTLVIRLELPGTVSFRELLVCTRELSLEAYTHQEVPFERLVEELEPERSLSHTPLFQVMFVLLHSSRVRGELSDSRLDSSASEPATSKFDLTLSLFAGGDGFSGAIEYSTDLFDRSTVTRMWDHFCNLVEQVVADPHGATSGLSLLSGPERHQMLAEWNDTGTAIPEECGIHRLFELQADQSPEAPAVIFEGRELSYGELNRKSNQLAHQLRSLGVGPEVRVGLSLDRSLELVIGLLGILKAGGAYVPLDPAYPRERRAFMLQDARAQVLVTRSRERQEWPEEGLLAICLDTEWETLAQGSTENPASRLHGDNLAYVIYTSGSTGRPKGVGLPHRVLHNLIEWHLATLLGGAKTLQFASLSFDVSFYEMFVCWGSGGTLFLVSEAIRPDIPRLADFLVESAIEKAILPVVVLQQLAEEYSREGCALPPLREITTTGEQLQTTRAMEDLFGRLGGCSFHNHYGPSESHVATAYTLDRDPGLWATHPSIGSPIFNTQIHLLGQDLAPVAIGVAGELYIGGSCLARGYLNRPDMTAERFVPSPFSEEPGARLYRTGDKVRRLTDGRLDYLGRLDHQVKIRGFRVEPEEVEAVLGRHPAVRQAVVLAREDVPGDKRLVSYVVPVEGRALSAGEVREHLRGRLPEYMVPSGVVILERLPLTPNGKIDRKALPAPAALEPAATVLPRTPLEEVMAVVWGEVLGVERVGALDNFFALGGHSLLAMRVVSRLRQAFGVELGVRELFEHPTLASLSSRVESALRQGASLSLPPLVRAERRGAGLPLSYAQQRLWFLDRLEPQGIAYNVPLRTRLSGPVSVGALARALREVVRRHEVLRTRYEEAGGEPVQVLEPVESWPGLAVLDLAALPEQVRRSEGARLARQESAAPFDLRRGPVFRVRLLRLEREDHHLVATVHHIASDEWSGRILLRELTALYEAFGSGRPSPLAELPVQYGDYAAWQRSWMEGEALEGQLAYWRQRLAGAPALLELPTDRPRPAVQTFRGSRHPVALERQAAEGLRSLARREEATPFMAGLALLQLLLCRLSGSPDVSVGTPISGRSLVEVEDLIGFFLNTLVIRLELPGTVSFRELLVRIRELSLEAYAHQEVPFERLVEELEPERSLSHTPLFQVLFVLLHGAESLDTGAAVLRKLAPEESTAKFDLTLALLAGGAGLSGSLEYNTNLFDATTAARWCEHLACLAEAAVREPERSVADLELLGQAQRHQVLREWNAGESMACSQEAIHRCFEQQARHRPQAEALVHGERSLSYQELNRWANQVAQALLRRGVAAEERVGICLQRSPEMVAALLGVLKAGCAYVPVDPGYPRARQEWMLGDAGVSWVMSRRGEEPEGPWRVLAVDGAELAGELEQDPVEEVTGDRLAYVTYTSGSTGRPKGVALRHGSVVALVGWAAGIFRAEELAGMLASTSISFDLSVFELFLPLTRGGRVVLVRDALDLASSAGVRLFNTVPSAMAELVRLGTLPKSVRTVALAGEPLRRSLAEDIYQTGWVERVLNLYGPSEDTIYSTWTLVERGGAGEPAIGRPLPGCRAYVLDGALRVVPAGVAGELLLGGVGLARGYLNRPELTAERFIPDPCSGERGGRLYRTGDLARWRADGNLEYLGRLDHQVKVRGFRIELGEVEAALLAAPGVREAVVVARGEGAERSLVSYVVPVEGRALSVGEVREHLRGRLPEYMVPSAVVILERLPLTPNGKIDRKALPAPESQAGDRSKAPRDLLELDLTRLWEEILGRDSVGITDDFFELGGHSLLAVRLLNLVFRRFGRELSLADLFRGATVERMARLLRKAAAPLPVRRPLVAVRSSSKGERPPVFWVHPIGGNVLCYAELARALGPEVPVYAFQSPTRENGAPSRIEEMADLYVSELLAVQPQGPYRLGGWSMGGLVAFEMAVRLTRENRAVEMLVLLDSYPPAAQPLPLPADEAVWVAWFATDLATTMGRPVLVSAERLRQGGGEPLDHLFEVVQEDGLLPSGIEPGEVRKLYEIFRANAAALATYRPEPYPGRLTLICAGQGAADLPQAWTPLATGGVEVLCVATDHYGLLRAPMVETIAGFLRERLREPDPGPREVERSVT